MADTIACEVPQCGGLAVFRCHDCARALCPAHQGMEVEPADLRLAEPRRRPSGRCDTCQHDFVGQLQSDALMRQAVKFAEREAKGPTRLKPAERLAAYDREVQMWEHSRARVLARLAAVGDESERLLLAVRHWLTNPSGYDPLATFASVHMGGGSTRPVIRCQDPSLFSSAFPEYWPSAEAVRFDEAPWNSSEIGRWFAVQARAVGLRPDQEYGARAALWDFRSKRGWYFSSNVWREGREAGAGGFVTVFIDRHGRLYPETGEVGITGLQMMAVRLEIEDPDLGLPERPRPS